MPLRGLLSDGFAAERRALIGDTRAVRARGSRVTRGNTSTRHGHGGGKASVDDKGRSTTHLTVADSWGNVVSYTFTIEQIGGSGIVVPDRGFLLNNELTDFDFAPTDGRARTTPGRASGRARAWSPTIVSAAGSPVVALGSPGGATIITTVLQVLVDRIDLGLTLPEAMAAPRASQRNSPRTPAEQAFITRYGGILQGTEEGHFGHTLTPATAAPGELGAVAAIGFGRFGRQQAVAEPTRRGGGSAMVVKPKPG